MKTPTETIDVKPGCFVVHPRGELHEWQTGPQRTLLFRVRYGEEFSGAYERQLEELKRARVKSTR